MKLYPGKVHIIATEIAKKLTEEGDIEVSNLDETILDIESVLKEYLRTEREISEQAKEILNQRGLPYSQYGKIKKLISEQKGFGIGEDALEYITNQIIGILMHSVHVEEIYSEDNELRKKMVPILKKHMSVDEEIESEVRSQIRHLKEGTREWEVEFNKLKEQFIKKHKLV